MGETLHSWIATNENRSYPFDATATRVTDSGELVMTDWIADLVIRCGHDTEIYLGCASITSELVTMIFMGIDGDYERPVLSVTATKESWLQGAPLFFRSMDNTVDGWITPGRCRLPETTVQYRFSSPEQSKLAERSISRRQKHEITYVENYKTQQKLTGVIPLVTGNTGTLAATTHNNKPSIEFGLTDEGLQEMANGINVVPETVKPEQPVIIQIAGAVPDCDGTIIIRFVGPFNMSAIINDSETSADPSVENQITGVTVGIDITLDDLCKPYVNTLTNLTLPDAVVCV
jgi:hypothetical protein